LISIVVNILGLWYFITSWGKCLIYLFCNHIFSWKLKFKFFYAVSCKSSLLVAKYALMKLMCYLLHTADSFAAWAELFANDNPYFVDKLRFLSLFKSIYLFQRLFKKLVLF
jgi:hypothetical protein